MNKDLVHKTFFDYLTIEQLFSSGISPKGTPILSYAKLLELSDFAKQNDYYVASIEAFEIKNGLQYSDCSKGISSVYSSWKNKIEMVASIDDELNGIKELIKLEKNPYGFQVYLSNDFPRI